MSARQDPLFSALIAVPFDGDGAEILGKSAAERQLEFALQAGCGRVVLLGYGGAEAAISLRQRAESAGAKCVIVQGAHAVAALMQDKGKTLVLQHGVVPASAKALSSISENSSILVVPAGLGGEHGYERIDLARSWAGALVLEDKLLARLLDLPEDIETAPALLRIALQARMPEKYLAEEELVAGSWSVLGSRQASAELEEKWLALHFDAREGQPSQRLVTWIVRRFAGRLHPTASQSWTLRILGLLAGAGGVAASYAGYAAPGFGLIAVAVLVLASTRLLDRLRLLPFGSPRNYAWISILLDLALAATGYFAIDWGWQHRLFPPLVLLGALYVPLARQGSLLHDWLGDRALIAVVLAVGAGFGLAEHTIMAICLLILFGKSPIFSGKSR